MNSLKKKIDMLIRAESAVIKELERRYPMHSPVRVMLMYGQINPSHGAVIGHDGGRNACVRVRLESRTQEVRSVAAENII